MAKRQAWKVNILKYKWYTVVTHPLLKVIANFHLIDQSLPLKIYKGTEHIQYYVKFLCINHTFKVHVKFFIQMVEVRTLATWSQHHESMKGLWKSMLYSKVPQGKIRGSCWWNVVWLIFYWQCFLLLLLWLQCWQEWSPVSAYAKPVSPLDWSDDSNNCE